MDILSREYTLQNGITLFVFAFDTEWHFTAKEVERIMEQERLCAVSREELLMFADQVPEELPAFKTHYSILIPCERSTSDHLFDQLKLPEGSVILDAYDDTGSMHYYGPAWCLIAKRQTP